MERNELILRFFMEDVGGVRITGEDGRAIYEDERSRLILRGDTNWDTACPLPREGQRGERWDLLNRESGRSYMVISSTFREGDETLQFHHLVDSSDYMELFRDINGYYWIDYLSGSDELRKMIIDGYSEEQIKETWKSDLEMFEKQRQPYLLYAE